MFVKHGEFQRSTKLTINEVQLRLEWNKLFHWLWELMLGL